MRTVAAVTGVPDYRGRAHLQTEGGVLLAANHIANVDPVLLARFVLESGRIPRFLAKAELFETPVLRSLLRGARQIPVYRERDNAADALRDAFAALRDGELVVIYPEGTFTTDPQGWPMLARRGVGRLALAADVPVVPVAQWGAQAVFGPGLRMRPRRLYSVLAGPPLDVMPGGSASAVTAELMVRIRDQLADLRGEPAPRRVWDPKQGARTSESHVRTDGVAA